jgi:very-short-patch-repair endonuclease
MADRPSFASSAPARQQHGILRLDQLSGMTRSKVRTEIRSGRWQSLGYGVVAVHNGPLTQQQQSFAVLLRCPPESALSGPTAAACDGLDLGRIGVDGEAVHVTLPCGNRRPRDLRAVVHWSEFLDDRDVHPTREPRRTRIARSIVDAASWQRTDRMARAVVLAGVQQRLVTPDRLDDALSRRGQCRHHGLILESITDARGGIASVPEHEYNVIIRGLGLPEPSRQVICQRPGGRYYLDSHWEKYNLGSEVDGAQHFEVGRREYDLDRLHCLTISGRATLLFSSFGVRHRPEAVGRMLIEALRARGWDGRTSADSLRHASKECADRSR